MKKLFLFAWILLAANFSQAQWEPDVRLTNDPDSSLTSYNQSWCIAASGDLVHVVWYDNRDGNWEIYYKRSTDGGISWEADKRLTNDLAFSRVPSIAASGNVVHVVWIDNRDGLGEVYYKRSTDGGLNWGSDTRLTYDPASSGLTSISVSGSVVHVTWRDLRDGNQEIYYKRSTDGGVSWEQDIRLTYDDHDSYNTSIAASGSIVNVVWTDNRDGNTEIYYKRSIDGGISWEPDIRLTNAPSSSNLPSIGASGSHVHIIWDDYRDGSASEIYYKHSIDGGSSWGEDTRLTYDAGNSMIPNLSVSGSVVQIVWEDDRDGDYDIYYKRSEDGGINWGGDIRLSNNNLMRSQHPSLSVSGSIVHVIWYDDRDGNFEVYYKRNPTGGFPVGINNELTSDHNQQISIYPNPACKTLNMVFNSATEGKLTFKIIDMTGRIQGIYHFNSLQGSNQYSIDLADVGSGLYFIELMTGGQKYFRKIVISK
jgi:hypothetical protein